jgi:hypothetical protein
LPNYRKAPLTHCANGSTKAFVARRYKVSEPTIFNWLKKNRIDVKAEERP